MKVIELIDRSIIDIRVNHVMEQYGLDTSDSYLILDNGLVVCIPLSDLEPELEVEVGEVPVEAESIRKLLKKNFRCLLNQPITDIICFREEIRFDKAFIELANGYLISEIPIAPNGTGDAGLWYFESIRVIEAEFGMNYSRLTEQ
ncbi:hypothetical protein Q0590_18365 [Rhodocytophaga aerolata]|uniref:Uncharacterized protein n=1 Tax=Rhodocytophaga aerolata TaxID=455078 RepID=A0ABT8R824_9BACT|nr:hypothetical protein [Rhodocytophaga aerolata]MDO1448245.1 hypothetical protein [Rhodocytophaga aerolata]